jgi:histidine triad (HIT) family protein
MSETVFSKIVAGIVPCYKIAETDNCLAFLDISPLEKGHTIVIPKLAVDYIFDINDNLYTDLFLFAKKVAAGVKKYSNCKKVGIAVVGLEIPHAHIHLIPLNSGFEIDFKRPKLKLTPEEFAEIAQLIAKNID